MLLFGPSVNAIMPEASRLVMAGRTLEEVRRVLGHKTLVMTARYAHFSQSHLHDVVAALDKKVETKTETPLAEKAVD